MDEAAINRVVSFSNYLRNYADLILEQCAVVSLDTWTLYEIEESFSLIFEVEKFINFHVLPQNNRHHPAIPQIQFLYDILQKVKKLRILSKPDHILPLGQQINLKCFRNLCYLELDSIPVNQLKGLQNVRPTLKYLTVTRVCSQISDILLKCGADKSTEYSWENLEQANFSRNPICRLESSLRLLPMIRILDLSYCQLVDAVALFCLPTISALNISYNKLTSMPALSENASNTLVSLNLSNNMIIDLRGIERFTNLEEIDLKENFISVEQTLIHLNDLPQLKYLNLLRNPITCGLNYRVHVLRCLNPAIKYCEEFRLDDSAILFSERKEIGAPPEHIQMGNSSSSSNLLKFLLDKVTKMLQRSATPPPPVDRRQSIVSITANSSLASNLEPAAAVGQNSNSKTSNPRRRSRRNQTRHVSISDQDDIHSVPLNFGSYSLRLPGIKRGETSIHNSPIIAQSLMEIGMRDPSSFLGNNLGHSTSNLRQCEDLPQISDQCSIPPSQSDKLLEEILNSHNPVSKSGGGGGGGGGGDETTTLSTDQVSNVADPVNMDSSMVSSSNSSFYKLNDSHSREVSPINTDDEDLEPNRELYTVVAKWDSNSSSKEIGCESDFVFLSFTQHFYKEKDGLSGGTLVKLNISSLQSLEVLSMSPISIQLHFSHPQAELRSRKFILEEEDFKLLKDLVEPIIEQNVEKDEPSTPLPCKVCGLPFYGVRATRSSAKESSKYCKHCGNRKKDFIHSRINFMEKEEVPLEETTAPNPTCDSDPLRVQSSNNQNLERKHRRNKSALSSDSSESVSICSSSEVPPPCRRGSDLELVSSPSLSSIEVLHENYTHEGDGNGHKWSDLESPVTAILNTDVRTPPDGCQITDESYSEGGKSSTETQTKEPVVMQESSSSGSLTGSVCTAVDRLSSGPSTPMKQKEDINGGEDVDYTVLRDESETESMLVIKGMEESQGYLSTSAKSTDTVCHRPSASLREAFDMAALRDCERKGIEFKDSEDVPQLKHYAPTLAHCYSSYSWQWWLEIDKTSGPDFERDSNTIVYSYDDFSTVDHRLKLYCELFLFTENLENLEGLVKCTVVLEDDSDNPFHCIVAVSNMKMYILRITGPENGDSPKDWLEVKNSCFLSEVTSLHTVIHKQGFVADMSNKRVLVCLADSERTNAFLYFVLDCLEKYGNHPAMDHNNSRLQSEDLKRFVHHFVPDSPPETSSIHLFQIVTLLRETNSSSNQFLVLTSSHAVLFEADLAWLFPGRTDGGTEAEAKKLVLTSIHSLDDMTHIEVFSDCLFTLDFYETRAGDNSFPWTLHVASAWVGCNVIQTLRPLWSSILKIDLETYCYTDNLLYLRQTFKDTPFSPYLP